MPEPRPAPLPSPVEHDRKDPGPALGETLSQDLKEKIQHPRAGRSELRPGSSSSQDKTWVKTGLIVGAGLLLGSGILNSLIKHFR
jgi:hypothetical protein